MSKATSKKAMIRARTRPMLKAKAEATFRKLGLSPSTAINLFYHQVVLHRGLPFEVALPNRATRRAMRDAATGQGLVRAATVEELTGKLDRFGA